MISGQTMKRLGLAVLKMRKLVFEGKEGVSRCGRGTQKEKWDSVSNDEAFILFERKCPPFLSWSIGLAL